MIGKIEGGQFESFVNGDDRDATVAHIALPCGFKLSNRNLVIMEVDEAKEIERLLSMNEDQDSLDALEMIERASRIEVKAKLVGDK